MASCSCSAREAASPEESAAEEKSEGEKDGDRKAERTGSEAKASSGEAGSSEVGEGGEAKEAAVRRSLDVGERRRRGVVGGGAAMAAPAAAVGERGVDLEVEGGRSSGSGDWGRSRPRGRCSGLVLCFRERSTG